MRLVREQPVGAEELNAIRRSAADVGLIQSVTAACRRGSTDMDTTMIQVFKIYDQL